MDEHEQYALEACVKHYGGEFREGENPPDGYIIIRDEKNRG